MAMVRWHWLLIGAALVIALYALTSSSVATGSSTERILSIIPLVPTEPLNFVVRKTAHIMVFSGIALILWRTFSKSKWSYVIGWAGASFVGLADEVHQFFINGRSAAVSDVILNSSAAAFTLFIAFAAVQIIHFVNWLRYE
ncbi:VanZ family protein [Sinobaca sp. H24]|uniref:VanZ family protein n=1 Tax=Sinobaca sp. H24 TaxID=2923376 RepID=UPI00207A4162|nr:VanZ family protein [Sinobaca sp. H24]